MEELRRGDPSAAEECHRRAHWGISADHPDASRIDPLPLRLVIAATHLDALEEQPLCAAARERGGGVIPAASHGTAPACRALQDLLMNALRYAAHMHNAWLVCAKEANASSLKNVRSQDHPPPQCSSPARLHADVRGERSRASLRTQPRAWPSGPGGDGSGTWTRPSR